LDGAHVPVNGGLPFGEKLGEPNCFQGKSWVMIEAKYSVQTTSSVQS
jgi:hypothetical protein